MVDKLSESSHSSLQKGGWLKAVEEATGKPAVLPSQVGGIVYLLLDTSLSMKGWKPDDAIQGAVGFAEDAAKKGYAVGVIRFAGEASIVSQPSRETASLRTPLEGLRAGGGTRMVPPMKTAEKEFTALPMFIKQRAIVLFTDGQAQDQRQTLEVADVLKRTGIEIITIGTEDADLNFLRQLATRADLAVATTDRQIAASIRQTAGLLGS